jgi:hypothetical protein
MPHSSQDKSNIFHSLVHQASSITLQAPKSNRPQLSKCAESPRPEVIKNISIDTLLSNNGKNLSITVNRDTQMGASEP